MSINISRLTTYNQCLEKYAQSWIRVQYKWPKCSWLTTVFFVRPRLGGWWKKTPVDRVVIVINVFTPGEKILKE